MSRPPHESPRAPLLRGKTVLVSGVGPGFGTRIALALADAGARLVLGARRREVLEDVAEQVRSRGGEAICAPTDITDPQQCAALVQRSLDAYGRVDGLINNAATGYAQAAFEAADLDDWRRTLEVNLFGSLQMCREVVPPMKAAGGGTIVFISSMNIRNVPVRQGGYTTSKGALLSAARVLARELGRHQIRVNTVVPGWMWGPSLQEMFERVAERTGASVDDQIERVASEIPLGFIPTDEDCTGAVVFLTSDLSRVITGQALDVNGGQFLD